MWNVYLKKHFTVHRQKSMYAMLCMQVEKTWIAQEQDEKSDCEEEKGL